jgi:phosphoribosylamine--glycine ligase
MKFIMCSSCGEGANILYNIQDEGNDVALWIKEKSYAQAWDGLLPKLKKPTPEKDDVVIFDFSGMGELADKFRKAGHHVIGGSVFADKMEQYRMFGLDAMVSAGIKIPLTKEFDDFNPKLVQDFLKEYGGEGKRWVFKPSGDGVGASLTYVSKDDEDLMFWVEYAEKYFSKEIDSFVLQQFVDGAVVSTEAWSNGNELILGTLNHTIEVKAMMNCGLGPATGCSGNILWAEKEAGRIAKEGLLRIQDTVVKEGYKGPIDLNVVANNDGIFGLEWCVRFGYSGITNLPLIIDGEVGKFFSDLAHGQGDSANLHEGFVSAVRITIPPYPQEPNKLSDSLKITPNVGLPIRGLPEDPSDRLKHFHFFEIYDEGDGILRHSPGTGVIADVRDCADDLEAAFERPYELLEDLILPNKQYRTDLAEVLGEAHEQVEQQENIWTNGNSQ